MFCINKSLILLIDIMFFMLWCCFFHICSSPATKPEEMNVKWWFWFLQNVCKILNPATKRIRNKPFFLQNTIYMKTITVSLLIIRFRLRFLSSFHWSFVLFHFLFFVSWCFQASSLKTCSNGYDELFTVQLLRTEHACSMCELLLYRAILSNFNNPINTFLFLLHIWWKTKEDQGGFCFLRGL